MKESSTESSYTDRIRSWTRTKAHGPSTATPGSRRSSLLPVSKTPTQQGSDVTGITSNSSNSSNSSTNNHLAPKKHHVDPQPALANAGAHGGLPISDTGTTSVESSPAASSPATHTQAEGPRAVMTAEEPEPEPEKKGKKNVAVRFWNTTREIILSSWVNVLLVFVPVGIAVQFVPNINPTIIFAMNAIAIIPLAGLLSHATESVAKRMGDTIGALMNVTFGNAVELIIFIALAKDEIRIVQASLLGSILANLLLILGMCFLIGGLRFREQIYNSTVTQMSACLLSLSVMSLLLPTAFHASFTDTARTEADYAVLQVSRGTSVVLLLVYGLYLLFQLKSHAYMYESTPQHIIDEESAPGPVAAWMDSSSSDSESDTASDSDSSRSSNTTAGRIRRVMKGRRRHRKSSAGSKGSSPKPTRSPSYTTTVVTPDEHPRDEFLANHAGLPAHRFGAIEDDTDDETTHVRRSRGASFNEKSTRKYKKDRKHRKKQAKKNKHAEHIEPVVQAGPSELNEKREPDANEPRRVDFAVQDLEAQTAQKKAFMLGGLNLRPAMPKTFSQSVFTTPARTGSPQVPVVPETGPIPRVRYGIRRTNSLPDRLNQTTGVPATRMSSTAGVPPMAGTQRVLSETIAEEDEGNISRTTAVVLLLVSTGLVAICAEFMVGSIQAVTSTTSLGETFVGLIILPIVGNAAEHVTAVTVASKNKMDLAIGVAVGSSIQIALFVTPFIVLLGWIMQKDMSLYFTLFETVSLFVSAFIVNFLVLDGRSNYLEGALLCAAYVIIAVASFFYPTTALESVLGGSTEAAVAMVGRGMGIVG